MKLASVFVSMFALSCSASPSSNPAPNNSSETETVSTEAPMSEIRKVGTYPLSGGDLVLKVSVTDDAIVTYTVTLAKDNQVLIRSTRQISKYMRWFMTWDDEARLWVYSGDIGTSVWLKGESGKYHEDWVVDHPELKLDIPNAIQEAMGTQ